MIHHQVSIVRYETPGASVRSAVDMIDGLRRMLNWDAVTLKGLLDTRGERIQVTEFDYQGVNKTIYEENGVTIRSWPAIHSLDGSVSYSLEWNGLKFAYSSDTSPNTWWAEYAKGADIAIHECFAPAEVLIPTVPLCLTSGP